MIELLSTVLARAEPPEKILALPGRIKHCTFTILSRKGESPVKYKYTVELDIPIDFA
jgi:hypothetical protein